MIRNIKSAIMAITMVFPMISATAQSTYSGYFTDGYVYRHQLNPAIGNDKAYISIPVLGNINMSLRSSNLGIDDILYKIDGKTTTFLNPNVNASEFLSNIDAENKIGMDMKMEILSIGFKAFNGYNTIGINFRTSIGMNIPGEMFRMLKEGISNQTYQINDMKMRGNAYAEIALGHSRPINDNLRVGATLKFLLGGANIEANYKKAELALGENNWTATAEAEIQASMKGLEYVTAINETTGRPYVDDIDVESPGIGGFGLALDLGAEYKFKDWTFSAALLDLGFINWSNNWVASTNGVKTFETNKYIFNVDDDAPNNFDDEMDRMKDELSAIYELENNGDKGSRKQMLGATLNLAAEYTLPSYKKLSIGALSTTRFQGDYIGNDTWTEFRLSANWSPWKALSIGANAVTGTYGFGYGGIIKFSGLHIAAERIGSLGTNFYFGTNVVF